MTLLVKLKLIFPVLTFSIILPTVDVATDLNLIIKLYIGTFSCNSSPEMTSQYDDYVKCLEHSHSSELCQNPRENNRQFIEYDRCRSDSFKYCSNRDNETGTYCGKYETHPRFASSLLTFFLINYVVCLLTFVRLEENKKVSFIFPLLSLYPQYGESLNYKPLI